MGAFGQFAATSQFYLYGRKHCTQTGYNRVRQKLLQAGPDPLDAVDLSGRVAMVTGANSGCGFEIASFLARKGAAVYMVCRSAKRGEEARQKIVADSGNEAVRVLMCDCSLEADTRAMWSAFCAARADDGATPRLDVLVCNAGVLLNERTLTSEGVETTLACHLLFGTYLLGTLAMPSLEATAGARVVVVSSGGMYNTKFPEWADATAAEGVAYNGNLAYAYAKRGQVLLCERWAAAHPTVKCVSCHPGWSNTPAVDEAYGEMKKYLEPLRTPWEGAEGIAWLCAADAGVLQSGGFYLDRKAETKHIAGPFFTEGSYTKNSPAEVEVMMANLHAWANGARALTGPQVSGLARRAPLREQDAPIELSRFMGRWYVVAAIPTFVDRGAVNSIEDYVWNGRRQRIDVNFSMRASLDAPLREYAQHAYVANGASGTRWSLNPKAGGVYLPLGLSYLVVHCADDYSSCIVGGPDRSFVYVMARTPGLPQPTLDALLDRAEAAGYERAKIERVVHNYGAAPPPAEPLPPPAPRTVAGEPLYGLPRLCIATMSPSHHGARAKAVLDAISDRRARARARAPTLEGDSL